MLIQIKYVYNGIKYVYTRFGSRSLSLLPNFDRCVNVNIFGVDMSSPVHIDNKKKDILILGDGPTQGLDDTTSTAEVQYSINFLKSNRKFCFHYNGTNSCLFVNATRIYQFKAKDSEIKKCSLCSGNISAYFSSNSMKKTGLNRCIYDLILDYRPFNISNFRDIHKYLMKRYVIK